VLPPDVNVSRIQFTPANGAIRFGLAAIKNVGTHAMESIIGERGERPYANLLDFCRRVDMRVCNKRVIESLIQGGAMDSLPGHRAQGIAVLDETVEAAQKWKKEREDLQLHLFGFTEETNWTIDIPEVRPYTPMQQLEFERELLGLYLSGHPLDAHEELMAEIEADLLHELPDYPDNADVLVPGMVLSGKPILTKKGLPMGFIELENRIAKVEVVLFPEVWKQASPFVQKGSALLVKARLQHQDEDVKLIADRVLPLDAPDAAEQARAMRREPAGRGSAPRAGGSRAAGPRAAPGANAAAAAPAGAGERAAASPARPQAAAARPGGGRVPAERPAAAEPQPRVPQARETRPEPARGATAGRAQRLFVKIAADREQTQRLGRLQALLQQHAGAMPVVLFYEREQRVLALSESYNVKPSPDLIREIGEIMGTDSARVK
jgi:DNA polymerase-3 subunit alpha